MLPSVVCTWRAGWKTEASKACRWCRETAFLWEKSMGPATCAHRDIRRQKGRGWQKGKKWQEVGTRKEGGETVIGVIPECRHLRYKHYPRGCLPGGGWREVPAGRIWEAGRKHPLRVPSTLWVAPSCSPPLASGPITDGGFEQRINPNPT